MQLAGCQLLLHAGSVTQTPSVTIKFNQFYYRLAIGTVAGNIPATKKIMLGSIFGERRVLLPGKMR